jgi:hypothetical protein
MTPGRPLLLLCLAVAAAGAAPQTPPAPTVGFVLSLDGPWQIYNRAIRQGEAVPAGARVLLASGTTFAPDRIYRIDIVLLDSKPLHLSCANAQACRTGLLLPGGLVAQTSFTSRLGDVFRLIFTTPDRYVGLMSRGGGAPGAFTDGVAKTDGSRVQLSPFFQGLPPATYRLELIATPADAAARPTNVDVAWDRSPASATVAAALLPALYRVTLSRPDDPAFAPVEAWILFANGDFAAMQAAYDEAVRATRSFDRNVPAKDVAIFRHAWLAHLAASRR